MLTRRSFLMLLIALSFSGCLPLRKRIPDIDLTDEEERAKFKEEYGEIEKVTTGYVSVQSILYLKKTLAQTDQDFKLLTIGDLVRYARVVKKNVTIIISQNFKIIKSVPYEEQLSAFADGKTLMVNWRKVKSNYDTILAEETEAHKQVVILLLKVVFENDFKLIGFT